MNLKNPLLTLLIASTSLTFSAMAQTPAKTPETKSTTTQPATEAKPVTAPVPVPVKTEPKDDPSLTNGKDMLPNDYSHRPAKPAEEKLTLIGRIQMRAMSGQGDTMWSTPGTDYGLVDFNFRRLRIGAMYQADHHWGMIVHMRLENALNKTTNTTTSTTCNTPTGTTQCVTSDKLSDSRGIIQEANLWYNFDFMRTRITFGMITVPFAREYMMSSANLINVERSMGVDTMQQFDNGLMINFNPLKIVDKSLDRYLTVWGMIGTGNGGNGDFGIGRRVDTNNNAGTGGYTPVQPFFYGRVQYNVFGGLQRGDREVGWQEGQEIFQKEAKLSIGAGIAGTNETKINNNLRVEFIPRTPSTATSTSYGASNIPLGIATGNNGCVSPCSMMAETLDVTGTWNGFYFSGAASYYGGNAGQNITSVTSTLGYNIHIKNGMWLMPVVRYDFIKGNFANSAVHQNTSGLSSDPANHMSLYWLGVNFFGDKHLFKLQLFYAINLNDFKGYDASGNALGGYRENLIIFQAQGTFWTGADIANKPDGVNF